MNGHNYFEESRLIFYFKDGLAVVDYEGSKAREAMREDADGNDRSCVDFWVCERGETVCFVEVKHFSNPEEKAKSSEDTIAVNLAKKFLCSREDYDEMQADYDTFCHKDGRWADFFTLEGFQFNEVFIFWYCHGYPEDSGLLGDMATQIENRLGVRDRVFVGDPLKPDSPHLSRFLTRVPSAKE